MRPRLVIVLSALLVLVFVLPSYSQGVRRCADCQQIILDEYVEVEGRSYHPNHILCAYCHKPIGDLYAPHDGKIYHGECYQKRFVVTCYVCGKLITEQYREDYWGNPSHAAHESDTPSCAFCGRFIVGGFAAESVSFPDGRRLCGICGATSVTSIEHVERLADAVEASLQGRGLQVDGHNVTYALIDQNKMKQLTRRSHHVFTGFTDYRSIQSDGVSATSFDISLLDGMPELEMAFTIAHELMHVWLFQHDVSIRDDAWVEGSCNYAAYLLMQDTPTREAAFLGERLQNDPDETYGNGFRRVRAFVDENRVEGWIAALLADSTETHPKGEKRHE